MRSMSRSAYRLYAIAAVRAETTAATTSNSTDGEGRPAVAASSDNNANGSANTECESLTSDAKLRARSTMAAGVVMLRLPPTSSPGPLACANRSEEHTSELQSL